MNVVDFLAKFKIFLGNGMAYFNDVKYPILLAGMLKVWFPSMTLLTSFIFCLLAIALLTLCGWIDLRFIKLHQRQAELSTRDYNPYFQQLEKKLKRF